MESDHGSLYRKGIEHFNGGEFFDAHEVWEELWKDYRGSSRKFYQGLIQAAVALYHLERGNARGARKLYYSSRAYLEPYRPVHLRLDLERFFEDFHLCFAELISSPAEVTSVTIDTGLVPKIVLMEEQM